MLFTGLRRKPARAAVLLAAGAVAFGALVVPATGAIAAPTAASATAEVAEIALEGTLLVAVVESPAATADGTETPADHSDTYVYAVRTAAGSTVTLDGDLPEGSKTGDDFAGTVVVPAEVLDELTAKQADAITTAPAPIAADAPEAIAAQSKASELSVDLPISDAQVAPIAAAAGPNISHTLYLAIPTISGAGTSYNASQAASVATTVANYWRTQSEGVLEGFTIADTRTYSSSLPCGVDPFDRWDEAAGVFGRSINSFVDNSGQHLVVMLPAACEDTAGIGVGTVGSSLDLGGAVQVVMGQSVDTTVLAHEIGHNLGLGHANLEYCGANSGYVGCDVQEYGDYYDVMGVSFSGNPTLTSLNGASKVTLGFVGGANMPVVQLTADQQSNTFDIALPTLSNLTGVQVIQVVDPISGVVRYVEYRSGTGSDAGSVYMANQNATFTIGGPFRHRPGVRLLETNADHQTEALTRWVAASGNIPAHAESALSVGASIATADASVTVSYLSGTAPAQVRITLTRGATPAATPVYRFWSAKNQTHFYTISAEEKKAVEDDYPDDVWKYEFVAYQAFTTQVPGTVPLFRFWSASFGGHFYTTSVEERDAVRDNYPDEIWNYENIAYFVYPSSTPRSDVTPVYRFWSALNKHHFYTASAAERDAVDRNYDDYTWAYEGEMFKVPNS